MDLTPDPDEQQIIDMTAAYLRKSRSVSRLHGENGGRFDDKTRTEMASLGWFGLGINEASGGVGFSVVDEMLLNREMGRQLGPLGAFGISMGAKIAAYSDNRDLTAELIGGSRNVALARYDPNTAGSRLLECEGAHFAVLEDDDGTKLVDLTNVDIELMPCLDKSVTMGRADLSRSPVLAEAEGGSIKRIGYLLLAAHMVGLAEAVTDMIVDYAKIRETFGRPIGSYQAVRHPCAEMAVRAFAARSQLFFAAVCLRDGRDDSNVQVDAAKALANDAALLNAEANIQLHGGIATTDEHDAHLYLKRANVLVRSFGQTSILDSLLATRVAT